MVSGTLAAPRPLGDEVSDVSLPFMPFPAAKGNGHANVAKLGGQALAAPISGHRLKDFQGVLALAHGVLFGALLKIQKSFCQGINSPPNTFSNAVEFLKKPRPTP